MLSPVTTGAARRRRKFQVPHRWRSADSRAHTPTPNVQVLPTQCRLYSTHQAAWRTADDARPADPAEAPVPRCESCARSVKARARRAMVRCASRLVALTELLPRSSRATSASERARSVLLQVEARHLLATSHARLQQWGAAARHAHTALDLLKKGLGGGGQGQPVAGIAAGTRTPVASRLLLGALRSSFEAMACPHGRVNASAFVSGLARVVAPTPPAWLRQRHRPHRRRAASGSAPPPPQPYDAAMFALWASKLAVCHDEERDRRHHHGLHKKRGSELQDAQGGKEEGEGTAGVGAGAGSDADGIASSMHPSCGCFSHRDPRSGDETAAVDASSKEAEAESGAQVEVEVVEWTWRMVVTNLRTHGCFRALHAAFQADASLSLLGMVPRVFAKLDVYVGCAWQSACLVKPPFLVAPFLSALERCGNVCVCVCMRACVWVGRDGSCVSSADVKASRMHKKFGSFSEQT